MTLFLVVDADGAPIHDKVFETFAAAEKFAAKYPQSSIREVEESAEIVD